jgi:hypothetical protein
VTQAGAILRRRSPTTPRSSCPRMRDSARYPCPAARKE